MRWVWQHGLVIVLEVVIGLFVLVVTAGDAMTFYVSYSSPLGTYTGQEDDRSAALRLLLLVVPSILVFIALVRVHIRHRRRRRNSAPGRGFTTGK
jgi:uncharacterized membrane-anchored protein